MQKQLLSSHICGDRHDPVDTLRLISMWSIPLLIGFAIFGMFVVTAARAQTSEYTYSGKMHFSIRRVPFSRYGSYLAISNMTNFEAPYQSDGVFLRTMHDGGHRAFKIELMHEGKVIPFTTSATPVSLTLSGGGGKVEICFQGPERLRFRGSHVQLRLVSIHAWAVAYPQGKWEFNTRAMKYMLWVIHGAMKESVNIGSSKPDKDALLFEPKSGSNSFEGELDAYVSAWTAHRTTQSFAQVVKQDAKDYAAWLKKMPRVPEYLGNGAELAAYIDWESVVGPDGHFKRPAMLMSKNWMTHVWSWDQCFNAMAMSLSKPALAWNQFLLPIDVQNRNGAFPDMWNAESLEWEFSKPPVHGWALNWMLQRGHFNDPAHLREVYGPLKRWTEWYFRYRDPNKDGLPDYEEGDDSGWDNSTVFRHPGLVESPDLSADLVVQMDVLSKLAGILHRPRQEEMWKKRATLLLHKMLDKFWTGHRFVAFSTISGKPIRSDSLLLDMPIILGRRLPLSVRAQLVRDIKKRLKQSPFGVPSEPTSSPFYRANGYWRGPIWAPSTMIIVNGLDSIGERGLANTLRKKFCLMAQKSGMSENFDAKTGKGLRDPAYTWTASVYLIFAHQLAGGR